MAVPGRLALARTAAGSAAVRDAIDRTAPAASIVAMREPMAPALPADAKRFYERPGFLEAPGQAITLVAGLGEVAGGKRWVERNAALWGIQSGLIKDILYGIVSDNKTRESRPAAFSEPIRKCILALFAWQRYVYCKVHRK